MTITMVTTAMGKTIASARSRTVAGGGRRRPAEVHEPDRSQQNGPVRRALLLDRGEPHAGTVHPTYQLCDQVGQCPRDIGGRNARDV